MKAKKILSIVLILCIILGLAPASAHGEPSTGTLYMNFKEITEAPSFNNGTTYIFLKNHYSSTDAVSSISGETAKLTMTETSNNSSQYMQEDTGKTPSKYVQVAESGDGFDSCNEGGIVYTTINTLFTGQWATATTGTGWYYWCGFSGCRGSGPYYAYTFDTVTFTQEDIKITVDMEGVTDTVTKDHLNVKVKGYNVTDYAITDDSVSSTDLNISLDVGGVAVTKKIGSTITFTAYTGSVTTINKFSATPIYTPVSDGIRAGYTFKGWSLNSDGIQVNYLPGSEFNMDADTTLYAVWEQDITYRVEFNKNNENSTYSASDQQINFGGHVNEVAAPSSFASGGTTFYFGGWNTKQDGSGEYWNFYGDVVSGNITLYAQWTTVDSYNIIFDDNIPSPQSDYVWNTGSLEQNGIAATAYVAAPGISRVDYTFDGWHTDSSCNASNAYNLNRTLNDNNAAGIDTNSDRVITLYAKWSPKYDSENDIIVNEPSISAGEFGQYYSDYIASYENNAKLNTPQATPVYRNFYLVNQSGTLANPSSLPTGLHLNSRTGEIYGVPEAIGDYTFYVRIANDEGKWISLTYPITVSIDRPDLYIDMKDDNNGISKIYGSDNTGLYSEELEITSAGIHGVVLDVDGSDVTLEYDYTAEKAARATDRTSFNPATAATLKFAPDLKDAGFGFIPDEKDIELSVSLTRTPGEDAGIYKIFLPVENIAGTSISMYQIVVADDLAALDLNKDDKGSLTTAPEYIYTIHPKTGMNYFNGAAVQYGTYSSGHDVKAVLTSGAGIVSNAGIQVLDRFQSVILTTGAVSTSGKIKAGTYNVGFTPIVINNASPKGTSQSEGAVTTGNYQAPAFELTISRMELTATGKNLSKALDSRFTTGELKQLISLNAMAKDDVGLILTSLTVGGINYDLTDADDRQAADTALAAIMKTAGTYPLELQYSNTLVGADAENYTIVAGEADDTSLAVYGPAPSGGGGGGGLPAPTNETINVLVNGKAENAGTAQTTTESGKTVTKVMVDSEKLEMKLVESGTKAVVTIPVPAGADVIIGELTGEMIRSMEEKSATLVLKTIDGQYSIPAEEIDIEGISEQLGASVSLGDIKVQIEISKPTAEALQRIEKAAKQYDYVVAVPPLDFTITCLYQNKEVEVKNFNTYVERWVALPEGADINKITTGIVLDPDGTVRHVPTKVSVIDGQYYAIINSLTNSTYCVVWHPVEFKDTTNHWAKESIHDMGSRMVISGVGNDLFQPNRNITRAEFAAIMVRALGLMPESGATSFNDVTSASWYSSYIRTASEYGLIEGVGNSRFNPNGEITREQAMAMVARAMTLTGLDADLSDEEMLKLLASYGDSDQASSWAKKGIAECIKMGIVSGKNGKLLAPKEKITRAEVAVITQRHLKESDLI